MYDTLVESTLLVEIKYSTLYCIMYHTYVQYTVVYKTSTYIYMYSSMRHETIYVHTYWRTLRKRPKLQNYLYLLKCNWKAKPMHVHQGNLKKKTHMKSSILPWYVATLFTGTLFPYDDSQNWKLRSSWYYSFSLLAVKKVRAKFLWNSNNCSFQWRINLERFALLLALWDGRTAKPLFRLAPGGYISALLASVNCPCSFLTLLTARLLMEIVTIFSFKVISVQQVKRTLYHSTQFSLPHCGARGEQLAGIPSSEWLLLKTWRQTSFLRSQQGAEGNLGCLRNFHIHDVLSVLQNGSSSWATLRTWWRTSSACIFHGNWFNYSGQGSNAFLYCQPKKIQMNRQKIVDLSWDPTEVGVLLERYIVRSGSRTIYLFVSDCSRSETLAVS